MYIWGKGRAAGLVGSDFLSAIVDRVGSTFRRVGSGPRKVTRGQLWGYELVRLLIRLELCTFFNVFCSVVYKVH